MLDDQLLPEEAERFTEEYYGACGDHGDYATEFPKIKSIYHVDGTTVTYAKIREKLDTRYAQWKAVRD